MILLTCLPILVIAPVCFIVAMKRLKSKGCRSQLSDEVIIKADSYIQIIEEIINEWECIVLAI